MLLEVDVVSLFVSGYLIKQELPMVCLDGDLADDDSLLWPPWKQNDERSGVGGYIGSHFHHLL